MSALALPPWPRSRAALGLTARAALGRFELQICTRCGAAQYPPREACRVCQGIALEWRAQAGSGELIAETTLHHSNDPYFRERLPWRLGLVRLDAGPTAIAHLHGNCAPAPSRVRVSARLDMSGQGVLIASAAQEVLQMTDDRQLREMTCDPAGSKVLVTDGGSLLGQALVRALLDAGADTVWAGCACESAGTRAIAALPRVQTIALDVTDAATVGGRAADIGAQLDILINNAENRGGAVQSGIEAARSEMELGYFGLLRLAEEFGAAMRSRRRDQTRPGAWVNLLSVYALSNVAACSTFSASQAAALSLSQGLRAQMRGAGIRVINMFSGPVGESQSLSESALAQAVVGALRDAVEDVYPGEIAQSWLARFAENPKVLERELEAQVRSGGH